MPSTLRSRPGRKPTTFTIPSKSPSSSTARNPKFGPDDYLGDDDDPSPVPDPQPEPAPGPPVPQGPEEDYPVDAPDPPIPWRKVKNRRDGFYRAWNQFNKSGELGKGVRVKGSGKTGTSSSGGKAGDEEKEVVASLDVDVEGNPGHGVETDEEGVIVKSQLASASYESAVANCRAKVRAIVQECHRLNQKYYDRTFSLPSHDTLVSLAAMETPTSLKGLNGVGAVKRVEDIYEDPEFFEDGATANDVRQGRNGDCWFLAAITALSGDESLIERICVERDEQAGVYGFVFFRDGEWISEVIDDRLCLLHDDDEQSAYQTEFLLKVSGAVDIRKEQLSKMEMGRDYGILYLDKDFRESLRKGSNALYFASCRTSNETWLPLLEKAYAKAHGDYQAIHGGFAGEGIEDLTGGVATYISSESVLDKEKLWSELLQVNDKFLFGCGSRAGGDYNPTDDDGFVRGHAYTVLEAREIEAPPTVDKKKAKKKKSKDTPENPDSDDTPKKRKVRLLKLHNPWGKTEWTGAWSDGSAEWTPELMKDLGHSFGDDGLFWISYPDFLKYYPEIDRIRLIGSDWHVAQQWTSVNVPWTAEYLDTSFKLEITKEGPVVLVLHQPDGRYFRGMNGRYSYELHFRLYKEGEYTYLLRSMEDSGSGRTCSAELTLEPGTYYVMVKVLATRNEDVQTHEEMIRTYRDIRREKLTAVAKSFDLAHAKGKLRELERQNAAVRKSQLHGRHLERLVEARKIKRAGRERARARATRIREAEKQKIKAKQAARRAEIAAEKEKREAKRKEQQAKAEAERPAAPTEEESGEKDKEPEKAAEGDSEKPESSVEKSTTDAAPAKSEEKPAAATIEQIPDNPTEAAPTNIEDSAKKTSPAKADTKLTAPSSKASSNSSAQIPTPASSPGPDTVGKPADDKIPGVVTTAAGDAGAEPPIPGPIVATTEEPTKANEEAPAPSEEEKKEEEKEEGEPESKDPAEEGQQPSRPQRPGLQRRSSGDAVHRGPPSRRCSDASWRGGRQRSSSCGSDASVAISAISSIADDDFSFDEAVDGPEYSDSEESDPEDVADRLYADDAWDAVCVIGLRVCSAVDDGAKVSVVHGVQKGEGADLRRARTT